MSSYNFFAEFYDALTKNVEYEVRSDYISDFFIAENIQSGTIIDLACGTGSVSACLARKGYNIFGVDLSPQMLSFAENKLSALGCDYSLINSAMQDFEADIPVDGVVCLLDSINHLTDITDVERTFFNVYKSLKNGGLFIFDVNTIYKHQKILFDNTFVFDEEDYFLVWDNEQVSDREVRILLDIFAYNGSSYDRYSEEFNEYAYSIEELTNLLNCAGFKSVRVYDDLTKDSPKHDSERLYFVCKKED